MKRPSTDRNRSRQQHGGVPLLLVLLLLGLAGLAGAVALQGAVAEVRATGSGRRNKTAFYCAEAGIQAARSYFAANYAGWSAMFNYNLNPATAQPPAGYPFRGDLDGDGIPDYEVTIRDNVDEFPPQAIDPHNDSDLAAIVTSRCIRPDLPGRSISQTITFNGRGTDYRYQAGHDSGHTGNTN